MAITVTLKLYATLRRYATFGPSGTSMLVPEGTAVEELIERLGIDPGEVKLVFVNAIHAPAQQELKDRDHVDIFPPVAGGKTEPVSDSDSIM